MYEGYPAEITRMWNDLPPNLSYVNAVYERNDHKIVFFIGKYTQKYFITFFLFRQFLLHKSKPLHINIPYEVNERQ